MEKQRLTEPQRRALEVLGERTLTVTEGFGVTTPGVERTIHAKAVARALWPDSAAWGQVTHRRGAGGGGPGTEGGTMPMKAGTLLNRLAEMGLAQDDDRAWRITERGRGVLAGTAEPLSVTRVSRTAYQPGPRKSKHVTH